jgi:hypothetical protein
MMRRALGAADVARVSISEDETGNYDLGEYASSAILNDPEFTKTEAALFELSRECLSSKVTQ